MAKGNFRLSVWTIMQVLNKNFYLDSVHQFISLTKSLECTRRFVIKPFSTELDSHPVKSNPRTAIRGAVNIHMDELSFCFDTHFPLCSATELTHLCFALIVTLHVCMFILKYLQLKYTVTFTSTVSLLWYILN